MKHPRDILVIDDEEVVLQGVQRICGSDGLAVDAAPSAAEGLRLLDKGPYRLVLCDIMMEDLDGFDFLAEAARRGLRAPVIMTTGYSTVENAVRSLQCGAIDYLPKPFTADELTAVIRRGLNYAALPGAGGGGSPCPPEFHRLGYVSWAALEPEGTVRIGVNDLFVKTMKGVRSVELLAAGAGVVQGTSCATITSADGLPHAILSPVSGEIIEAHGEAAARPALLEQDPYGGGWLYRVLPSDLEYNLRCLDARGEAPETSDPSREGEPP